MEFRRDVIKEKLKVILSTQREKYRSSWESLWKDMKPHLQKFISVAIAGNIDLQFIKEWKDNLPGDIQGIFRYLFINYSSAESFLNNPKFKEILKHLYSAKSLEEKDELFMKAVEVPNMGVSIVSSWWTVFSPDGYIPVWGTKVKGSVITTKLEQDLNITIGDLLDNPSFALDFIKLLRSASKEVDIGNLLEAAYYLSKYTDGLTSTSNERIQKNVEVDVRGYLMLRGHFYPPYITAQFYTALKTKGFVILSGLSGTGKTKIALEFAELLGNSNKNTLFLSVRPDWRDSKPLLGYYNPLDCKYYKTPLLEFILRAIKDYEQNKENAMPYFIILDEMNLAHVEYYFADFLSVLESGRDESRFTRESIKLHNVDKVVEEQGIPKEIKLPPNLYIIGTVNIDETTYMFSPKVLDRAFTIEFHDVDLEGYPPEEAKLPQEELENLRKKVLDDLRRGGKFLTVYKKGKDAQGKGDIEEALEKLKNADNGKYWQILQQLNKALEPYDLHFGYRVVEEIALFFRNAKESWDKNIVIFENEDEIFDLALLMKILPKFHGNRKKLENPLKAVFKICLKENQSLEELNSEKIIKMLQNWENERKKFRFPHTANKVLRMLRQLYEIGFASFS